MIPFNIPVYLGTEIDNIHKCVDSKKICGNGDFTSKCHQIIEQQTGVYRALLTTSCSHALELAAILANIKPEDEIIMSSFTFSSTANAFALRGGKIVFVDVRPDTMNIDEALIEDAITVKTKAIVPVHYAGISCEMDTILDIANRYNLIVIEDAAQGFGAFYKNKMLGSLGDIGCYSFHETKNVTCGEGGAILIKNKENSDRAEIIREKGTNRSKFLRGEIDKYTWVDIGSSYLPSEINAAFLYTQLQNADMINKNRIKSWNIYYEHLKPLEKKGYITLPHTPDECKHNGHIFYIKTGSLEQREKLIGFLRENNICTAFHYIPLHSSPAGQSFGRYHGTDKWTTKESECLLRLPLFFNLDDKSIDYICEKIDLFFKKA